MESPKTRRQAIELDPSCSGKAYSNRPGTSDGYESTELGCTLTVTLCFMGNSSTKKRERRVWQDYLIDPRNWRQDLNLFWRASENPLKDHAAYGQGPGIHDKPERSLIFGEAQLAKCLKV